MVCRVCKFADAGADAASFDTCVLKADAFKESSRNNSMEFNLRPSIQERKKLLLSSSTFLSRVKNERTPIIAAVTTGNANDRIMSNVDLLLITRAPLGTFVKQSITVPTAVNTLSTSWNSVDHI